MTRPVPRHGEHAIAAGGAVASSAQGAPAPSTDRSYTLSTDAGTRCTYEIESKIGGGFLVRPISYQSTIMCTPADPAKVPVVFGGKVVLQSSLLLGIGGTGSSPKTQPTRPPTEEGPAECDAAAGVDCGFTGQATLLPAASYTLLSAIAIPAPQGETWNAVPTGCAVTEGLAECFFKSAPFRAA